MKNGCITIDGFDLQYRIEGEGTPVLVIGSAVYYPRLFSQAIKKELKLIFIDHRGFTQSPRVLQPQDYSLDRVVEDIEFIREALQVEDFIIMGHSGHAFLAVAYAQKYPKHVQKVILLNSAPTNSLERQQQSIQFFDEMASPERKKKLDQDLFLLTSDLEKDPERRFAHLCIRLGAQSFYDYMFNAASMWDGVYTNMQIIDHLWGEAFAQRNLLEGLAGFAKPVFIGLGRYDYLVGPVSLWDMIDDQRSTIEKIVFEHSGHNPMLEEPELFDSTLLAWIRRGESLNTKKTRT